MNEQKYTLFASLPIADDGHIVVDADEIDMIRDYPLEKDKPASCWVRLRGSANTYRIEGNAKDLLQSINKQRINQLYDLSRARLALGNGDA